MFLSGPGEGFLGLGVDERKLVPSSLTIESRLTSRFAIPSLAQPRPTLAQARRGSCWKRQQIEVVTGLAIPARGLRLSFLPLPLPPFFLSVGWGES